MKLTIARPLAVALAFVSITSHAGIRLPSVLGDHMVLQRDLAVPIWGQGDPDDTITVSFAGQTREAVVSSAGTWQVRLDPLAMSREPRTLTIHSRGGNETLTLTDVLVGDVWLCSGQSNMQWALRNTKDADIETQTARHPEMRLYQVDRTTSQEPRFSAKANWTVCSPETIPGFSAVGYFFGRDLHRVLDVPVGLLDSSWGGTPAEAWTRNEALASNELTLPILERWTEELGTLPARLEQWEKEMAAWRAGRDNPDGQVDYHQDPGVDPAAAAFARPDFDAGDWKMVTLPGTGNDGFFSTHDGAAWYRRVVELPAGWKRTPLRLELGPIDDFDMTYVNGTLVGSHDVNHPNAYSAPRAYTIPASVTDSDQLVIAVRVFDWYGAGGFDGNPGAMRLVAPQTGDAPLPLDGAWAMGIEKQLPPATGGNANANAPRRPRGPESQHRPGNLAQGMIAPLVPYAIRGAIWYQGESNAGRAYQYRTLLPMMIQDWRERWGQGEFPFGIVQLANFMAISDAPTDPAWAHLRDAQRHAAVTDPATGLAVIIDVGEANDIHPRNKQEVGRRLARWALADVYARTGINRGGPEFLDHRTDGNRMRLRFRTHGGALQVFNGWELNAFSIAGEDRIWHPAQARIQGEDTVEVWSDAVPEPVAARYAWSNNPASANLVNARQLPAGPFRTDDWEGPTRNSL